MNEKIKAYFELQEKHNEALAALENEVQRIIAVIKRVFKKPHAWWAYAYYEKSQDEMPLPAAPINNIFFIYISERCDSYVWKYSEGFPVTFFDMSDAAIEGYIKTEIAVGIKAKEDVKLKYKAADELKKAKKKAAIESAKSKLTIDELKALGL